MKFLNLAASVCLAMALVACGDDSSSSPNVPADNNLPQQDTSTVSPATNPDNPAGTQDSVPQNTTPQDSVQQGPPETTPTDSVPPTQNDSLPVTEPENPVDTDPYAVGTDVDEPSYVSTCQIKPLEKGNGDGVYCNSTYAGPIFYDTDESVYDPSADNGAKFVSINKVFESLKADDRVVFVLRHADRQSSSGKTSHLTDVGIFQAQSVGQKIASAEQAYYAHSEYVRTRETLENIAVGRGETEFIHDAYPILNGSWYIKDNARYDEYKSKGTDMNYTVTTEWAYNGEYADAFYDLDERTKQFVDEFLVNVISKKARISVVCSHDQFLVPLVISISKRQIGLRYYDDRSWINYLAGMAVVISADGTQTLVPIKGLDSGAN